MTDQAAVPLAHVVVISRCGPLLPAQLDEIATRVSAELPFAVRRRLCWTSDTGAVGVLAFAGSGVIDVGASWDVTADGVVAFSGLPVPRRGWWTPQRPWAALLRTALGDCSVEEACRGFFGVFSMLRVGVDGAGTLASDELGVGVLYRADGPDRTAIATRASAAGIAALHPQPLRRDLCALGWLLSFDNIVGEGTGYSDVRALPARSVVRLDRHASVTVDTLPALGERLRQQQDRAGAASDEITAHVLSIADAPGEVAFGLTGGRDSRLVLGHVLDAGMADRFDFITWDLGGDDPEVAAALAADHRLRHEVVTPVESTSWRSDVDRHLRRSDGMLPATEAGRIMPASGLFVSGVGGELLSTYYGAHRSIHDRADVAAALADRVRRPAQDTIATADTIAHYAGTLEQLVAELVSQHPLAEALSFVYLDHRLHRWQGTVRESAPRADIAPLLSPTAVAGALRTSHDDRRRFAWHDRLLQGVRPSLTRRPYGSADSGRPISGVTWSATAAELGDVLLDEAVDPVFELIDRQRVAAFLASEVPPPHHVAKQLINAFGLARWVNGE